MQAENTIVVLPTKSRSYQALLDSGRSSMDSTGRFSTSGQDFRVEVTKHDTGRTRTGSVLIWIWELFMFSRLFLLVSISVLLSGCAVNPVTGKNELVLVGEQWELETGAKQYAPARQSQGGDYVADPELSAYVSRVGQRLAAVSDRKLPYEFKVLNNSVPNAWAMPGGKITVNRGLLTELQSESELAAVLGHEIVHAAAKHGAQGMTRGIFLQAGVVGLAVATKDEDYAQWAQTGGAVGAQLINRKYGRDDEREADHYGMLYMSRAGYDPQGAVDLQRTFLALQDGGRQDWISGLFASHPPSQERLQNNIAMLATLPKGGEIGGQRYQAKIAHLVKTKPAYEAFDKGREALKEKDFNSARKLAQQAIALEPNEAVFYGLLGDVEQKNRHLQQAVTQYSKAISLNPDYFYHYLQRGIVNQQLNFAQQAEADLKHSVQLFPTANAYYSLGNLSRQAGQLDVAKDYYAKVAAGGNEIGQQAYGALVDLDLKDNPADYIKVKTRQNEQGVVVAEISNPTPRAIDRIELAVDYKNAQGRSRRLNVLLRGSVAAGSKRLFDPGITRRLIQDKATEYSINIIAAQIVN